jgi:hypothetical protein
MLTIANLPKNHQPDFIVTGYQQRSLSIIGPSTALMQKIS